MLYFGYGSNLCERDWGEWCSGHGEEASGLRFVRRAWLPEHELAFTFNSGGRGGGVLDVVERFGQAAPGALFEIDENCRSALDGKEGSPGIYAPKEILALDDEGGAHAAFTYVVTEDHREDFVEPAPGYAELVAEGCDTLGIKKSMLQAAVRGATPAWEIPSVFVYGSLRTGEYNHAWLQREGGVKLKGIGSISGVLHDCGAWPAMLAASGDERVLGELWRSESPDSTLRALDELEGFAGWGVESSLFLRGLTKARMSCGGEVLAWTYRYAGESCDGAIVPSGDWASR